MAPNQARRAGLAAFVGTTIEWYDFFIYGFAAALVFPALFFPDLNPVTSALASFATFGAAYVMRPLGAIVFGHIGDRIGRKASLVSTLLIMGISTFAIGLLPTYENIGLLGAGLLVLCRLLQGLSAGGEFGGAVLIASEHAKPRGFVAAGAWAQQGAPAGNILSAAAFSLVSLMPEEQFMSYGWRIPFLVSAVLVVVGLVIRMSLEESPAFVKVEKQDNKVKLPMATVLRTAPLVILLGAASGALATSVGSSLQVFGISWLTGDLHVDRQIVLNALIIMSIVQFVIQPLAAPLAIRFQPLTVIVTALLAHIVIMPIGWFVISRGDFLSLAVGMSLVMVPPAIVYGLLGGFLAQTFPAEVRYTGIGMSYQLGALLFTAPTPAILTSLMGATGSIWSIIGFQFVYLLISLVAAVLLSRKTGAGRGNPSEPDTAPEPTPAPVASLT